MNTRIAFFATAAVTFAAVACSSADPSAESGNHLGTGDAAADEGDSGAGGDDASTGGDASNHGDSSTGADSGTHDDSGAHHDSGTAADSGGHDASTLGAFGASCAVDGDCASGLCRGFRQMTVNFCTKACTAATQAADCPSPPSAGTCNGMGYCKFN
jgi:hypothetical protein